MARTLRPSTLLWGLFFLLGGAALSLRLRNPAHGALPWLTGILLGLLALRVGSLALDWRQGRLPATRLLLPAILLAEGLGLTLVDGARAVVGLRLATAVALEVLLLALAFRALRRGRSIRGEWPEQRIAGAFEAFVPPRAARLMALELVMLGSALRFVLGGFRHAAPAGFSHHRESALGGLLLALPLLIPGDFLLTRALFSGLAPWLRWTLHASTLYAVLWLFGYYATLKARPHQIIDGQVHLHQGLLKSATFPAGLVLSAAPLPEFDDDWARLRYLKGVEKLVAKGNAVLELRLAEPVRVEGLWGPGRPTTRLLVTADDPSALVAAMGCPCA